VFFIHVQILFFLIHILLLFQGKELALWKILKMKNSTGIKLFAPACISMLSYGLKDVSIAIEKPGNEIFAKLIEGSNKVEIKTYTKEKDDQNGTKEIIFAFVEKFIKTTGSNDSVELEIYNRIPFQSGLGNLEANITGVISAVNDLLKGHFKNQEIFDFILSTAKEMDVNILPSNVAANIFGGIILYNENLYRPVQKLYVPHGLNISIINKRNIPNKDVFENISSEDLFKQSINNAGFIKSLFTTDHDLFSNSLKENVFDEKIGANIDWYADIRELAYKNEVYSIGFSHYGETVFIINPNTLIKDENHKAINEYFKNNNIKADLIETIINLNGLYKY